MLKDPSFSKKIMLILGLTSLIIILGISLTTLFYFQNDLERRVAEELDRVNESTYNLIDSSLNASVSGYLRAIGEQTRELVKIVYDRYKQGELTFDKAFEEVRKIILDPDKNKIGETGYLVISDMEGNLLIHPYWEGKNVKDQEFMKYGIVHRDGYFEYDWKNPKEPEKRRKVSWFAHFEPWNCLIWVTSYKDEFRNLMNIKALKANISSVELGETGYIYILDMKGNVIVHPSLEGENVYNVTDKNPDKPDRKFIQEIIAEAKKEEGKRQITYHWSKKEKDGDREENKEKEAKKKIVVYKRFEALNWIICSSFYYEDLYAPLNSLKDIIIVISLIFFVLIILFSIFIGKSLSKSIKQLTDGAESIGTGNLEVVIPIDSKDEIGSLAKTFNSMAKNLKTSKIELEKAKIELEDKVKERTKELKIQKEKAEKASQTKSIFLGNMSHEIRTPLTSILGHTELLLPLITDKRQKDSLENIKASSKTLKEFIDNTIYMSKIEAEKFIIRIKPANLYSILNEMRGSFTFAINKKELQYYDDIPKDFPQCVELDELRVKQVLINLINNAIKYTDEGHVKLSLQMKNSDSAHDRIDLLFTVEDTGIGISKEDQKKLFEPFERLEGKRRLEDGAGLGLALSKKIIELMGGEIFIESEPGKGSTFTFVLKNVKVPEDQDTVIDGEKFDYSSNVFEEQKMLVVDDEENIRAIIRGYLDGTSIQVFEAEDGEKALKIIREIKPDLILMDIKMPVMDGIEATEKIREDKSLKGIPILAFTASKTLEDEVEKYKHLFERYLLKPITKARFFFELSHFLKLKGDDSQKKKEEVNIELTPENQRFLPEIIEQLDKYMELWEMVCESNNFREYKKFGLKIKGLGETYSFDPLIQYGDEIIKGTEIADIDEIESSLKMYTGLIERLKPYIKE